ncbi:hypothetical protein Acr_28g0005050 [Actinidia rufa]|uniref:Uncharacterized protein n=1 Tax=Actinidia rufa TaxID=165716 RepID=A0A7J0H9K2_9ERIC|nr:hypothetical protein Acr_28g0005050 [Actinidia rufa]
MAWLIGARQGPMSLVAVRRGLSNSRQVVADLDRDSQEPEHSTAWLVKARRGPMSLIGVRRGLSGLCRTFASSDQAFQRFVRLLETCIVVTRVQGALAGGRRMGGAGAGSTLADAKFYVQTNIEPSNEVEIKDAICY